MITLTYGEVFLILLSFALIVVALLMRSHQATATTPAPLELQVRESVAPASIQMLELFERIEARAHAATHTGKPPEYRIVCDDGTQLWPLEGNDPHDGDAAVLAWERITHGSEPLNVGVEFIQVGCRGHRGRVEPAR